MICLEKKVISDQLTIDRSLISMRGTEYAMALAADIAYNQRMFWGKRDYSFQPLCEQLGWDIKNHFLRNAFTSYSL